MSFTSSSSILFTKGDSDKITLKTIQKDYKGSLKKIRKYVNSKTNPRFLWLREIIEYINIVFAKVNNKFKDIEYVELDIELLFDILLIVDTTSDVDDIHEFVLNNVIELLFPYQDRSYLEGQLTKNQQKLIALLILSKLLWYRSEFKQRDLPLEKIELLEFLNTHGSPDIFKLLITEVIERNISFSKYFLDATSRIRSIEPELGILIEEIVNKLGRMK